MANKMLIDATHPEETRVVVVRGSRVEEFDFEAANRKPLRGNIYLAKVTRVEPSLQAAFVEYGGNRHGFLAFSEIHPDYYQIPVADRQALLAEEERQQRREAEEENEDKPKGRSRRGRNASAKRTEGDATVSEAPAEASADQAGEESGQADAAEDTVAEAPRPRPSRKPSSDDEGGGVEEVAEEEVVEQVGSDDAMEEVPERAAPRGRARTYKIQEVIKRRQIMLVQVVKEERGNKGAALTTYLSLAGRYSVLMPNTARGGGISRKITSAEDRKRLKEVASDLEVPEGMGVILRTAGANRTKAEIKRDFEYLLRLWENVRELTLASTAPSLVYEEGSLVKRSIRDLYNKDIDEVLVAGDEGYREAKDFMRMLMPSHAKNVKPYKDPQPVFARFGVESQLDAMFSPVVQLRSGGYIVINPTEALVSIDVNSGRSTREHNIEDTALKTNLEAAEEVARQLRLRDLAGLIVIDFIDMDEKRNNRAVERKLKDCLKNDRARIQLGRISHFGLMEMSRQRIRTGVLESSTEVCPHCGGTGHVRSSSSVALQLLRAVEDMLLKSNTHDLIVRTRAENALYVLNHKRAHLHELEERFGVAITISADATLTGLIPFAIDKGEPVANPIAVPRQPVAVVEAIEDEVVEEETAEEEEDEAKPEAVSEARTSTPREGGQPRSEEGEGGRRRRRRRRRRRGGGNGENGHRDHQQDGVEAGAAEDDGEDDISETEADAETTDIVVEQAEVTAEPAAPSEPAPAEASEAAEEPAAEAAPETPAKRTRGRRGGRRTRGETAEGETVAAEAAPAAEPEAPATPSAAEPEPVAETPAPRRRRSTVRERAPVSAASEDGTVASAPVPEAPQPEALQPEVSVESMPVTETSAPAEPAAAPAEAEADNRPRRTGWWNRKLFGG
ncbi:ribonuclease E/G [Bosea sp. 117]|uniref:Rne/Rng family ribonuclease n=1 Tax=Bosea sp. 117 TaxID=1125973 RepID=UPI0004943315|nr:ribonuclease E/G [Bosea sp. 117]